MIEIVLDSFHSLFRSVDMLLKNKDLSLGAILAGLSPFFALWVKISREKEKKVKAALVERRQLQIAFNVNEIMEHFKVESKWSLQEIGSTVTDQRSSRNAWKSLHKAFIRRGKKYMSRLKSRKLWLAIAGALIPVLNTELGIDLDSNLILGMIGILATAIAAFAHVDAKKVEGANVDAQRPTDTGSAV